MSDNPLGPTPEGREVLAQLDELRVLRSVIDEADKARARRGEIWLALRERRAADPKLMRALGITQEAIAEASGVTPTTLSQFYTARKDERG